MACFQRVVFRTIRESWSLGAPVWIAAAAAVAAVAAAAAAGIGGVASSRQRNRMTKGNASGIERCLVGRTYLAKRLNILAS